MKEDNKSEVALREEEILKFWRNHKTFEKSLSKDSPRGNYVFYDGPPFATGKMHYGHILGSTAKDVVGRYQTMQGYHVPRKWGWDCHGLPIENIVEKDLDIAGHNEIEVLGIDKFVEYARSKVLQYDKDWEVDVERMGRWVDFKGSYKTMDNTFMESAWWALGELNKKGLIYEGVRVLAYCPRCETPISNSEIAMDNSYKDITDISVYVKFELLDEPGTYLVAWTTTPWTLPGNTAIAINKNFIYVKVQVGDEKLIMAKETLTRVMKDKEFKVIEEMEASKLVGKRYKPLFNYYLNKQAESNNIWKIWHADFVTLDKGTGIAHEAPAFGEEDMDLARANDIPWIVHVDETGRFKAEVLDFAGMKVKPKADEKDGHQAADIEVIKYLAKQNPPLLFDKEKIVHPYPHCMRCETPIIYYALPSWFINISKVKQDVIKRAEDMNWIPSHLKDGRFNNIVVNAPDWNISRNRYWATALPIWRCEDCKSVQFVNSIEDLKNRSQKSGNKYFVMRHGETDMNVKGIVSFKDEANDLLNKDGRGKVVKQIQYLKDNDIDLIITSPFARTVETAEIIRDALGIDKDNVIQEAGLGEINPGHFDGQPWDSYHSSVREMGPSWFNKKVGEGESFADVKRRTAEVLYRIEREYKNRNVLIVTHGSPGWSLFVNAGLFEPGDKEYHPANSHAFIADFKRLDNAEIRDLPFIPIPHNANYELDLHRPYIDGVKLSCNCGSTMHRVPEVLDCWVESGSMPFAQDHFPFENKDWQKQNFPADFVAEYISQTRTWFYYTHVLSTILFNKAPFRNVVTTGTLRAEDGHKISKSKNNFPDPYLIFDKYGVDALRIYLMASPLMKGEDSNFSEKSVQEICSKVIGRLYNVYSFYELYRDVSLESDETPSSPNVLDEWILLRLSDLTREVTSSMEDYDMAEAIRPIMIFIDDLSTWYLRRCRDRIKDGDVEAKKTLYFILKNLVMVMAPFSPFAPEDIWLKLRGKNDQESVHLSSWPLNLIADHSDKQRSNLENMDLVRKIVSLGLEARHKAGIKVRQPLSKLEIKGSGLNNEFLDLIRDELNVKEVVNSDIQEDIILDLNVTPELKEEGNHREFVRALQEVRKQNGLIPGEIVSLIIQADESGQGLVNKYKDQLSSTVGIRDISFEDNKGSQILVDDMTFVVSLVK